MTPPAAVPSDGFYGVPEGIVFGVPTRCRGDGTYDIQRHLELDGYGQKLFKKTLDELVEEREAVTDLLGDNI